MSHDINVEARSTASKLTSLPQGLICRILSFNDSSHLSLPLWIVGNRELQRILEEVVDFVELRSSQKYAPLQLPFYLTKLRSLRHLIVDRSIKTTYYPIYDQIRTLSILKMLPDTIETLILRIAHSKLLFFPNNPTDPHLSLKNTFPRLQRLQLDLDNVWSDLEVSQLPSTLTGLHLSIPHDDRKSILNILKALPANMENLVMGIDMDYRLSQLPFFESLPPQLTSLTIITHQGGQQSDSPLSATQFAALPRSITSLDFTSTPPTLPTGSDNLVKSNLRTRSVSQFHTDWSLDIARSVPPFLSKLHILNLLDKKPEASISALPSRLEMLSFESFKLQPSHIRTLPRSLTDLKCGFKQLKDLKSSDFPPTLRRLHHLGSKLEFDPRQLSLLPALVHFKADFSVSLKIFSQLPPSIITLSLDVTEFDATSTFPPKLSELSCGCQKKTSFEIADKKNGRDATPKRERAGSSPVRSPTPSSPSSPSRLLVKARSPPPVGSSLVNTFPLSRLPRSMIRLCLTQCAIPSSQLAHLPPQLQTLELDYLVPDADFEPKQPKILSFSSDSSQSSSLNSLRDSVHSITNPDLVGPIDLLPRTLTHLKLVGYLDFDYSEWKRLPSGLTRLEICPFEPLEADILPFISGLKLDWLSIYLRDIDDKQAKALPPKLNHLFLNTEVRPPSASPAAISYIPITNNYLGNWMGFNSLIDISWREFSGDLIQAVQDLDLNTLKTLIRQKKTIRRPKKPTVR